MFRLNIRVIFFSISVSSNLRRKIKPNQFVNIYSAQNRRLLVGSKILFTIDTNIPFNLFSLIVSRGKIIASDIYSFGPYIIGTSISHLRKFSPIKCFKFSWNNVWLIGTTEKYMTYSYVKNTAMFAFFPRILCDAWKSQSLQVMLFWNLLWNRKIIWNTKLKNNKYLCKNK